MALTICSAMARGFHLNFQVPRDQAIKRRGVVMSSSQIGTQTLQRRTTCLNHLAIECLEDRSLLAAEIPMAADPTNSEPNPVAAVSPVEAITAIPFSSGEGILSVTIVDEGTLELQIGDTGTGNFPTIELYDSTKGGLVTVANNGQLLAAGLTPGTYFLRFISPAGAASLVEAQFTSALTTTGGLAGDLQISQPSALILGNLDLQSAAALYGGSALPLTSNDGTTSIAPTESLADVDLPTAGLAASRFAVPSDPLLRLGGVPTFGVTDQPELQTLSQRQNLAPRPTFEAEPLRPREVDFTPTRNYRQTSDGTEPGIAVYFHEIEPEGDTRELRYRQEADGNDSRARDRRDSRRGPADRTNALPRAESSRASDAVSIATVDEYFAALARYAEYLTPIAPLVPGTQIVDR